MNKILHRSAVIAGITLGIAALVVSILYPARTILTTALALLSAGLLIFYFLAHFESFKAFSKKRSTHLKLNNAVMIGLFVFIVVLLNLMIRQYYFRFDNSLSGRFTLSSQSRSVAEMLEDEVHVLFFGVEGDNDYRRMHDLLEAYRHINKNLSFTLYDLDTVPLVAKENNVKEYNTIVVRAEKRVFSATGADEETLTNLLIRTMRNEERNIHFLSGYEGRSILDTGRTGYSALADRLKAQGYAVRELEPKPGGAVPHRGDILVVPGIARSLSEESLKIIRSFENRGGKLVILIDDPAPVKPLLKGYGLAVSDLPILDPVNIAGSGPSAPLVTMYRPGGITDDFTKRTVYPGVHSISATHITRPFEYNDIAFTSHNSWYDRNGDGIVQNNERSGSAAVVGVLSSTVSLMKAVIFGDADFVSNAYLLIAGNENMFMNVVNWLDGEGGLAKIAPGKVDFVPMYITKEQADLVRLFVPIGIPVLIGVTGILMWYKRRSL